MKKLIYVLAFLLLFFSAFTLVLYGASGHRMRFEDPESRNVIFVTVLHLFTATALIIYNRTYNGFVKWLAAPGIALTAFSIFYTLYEISKIKIGDYAILIPIGILIGMIILCFTILYQWIFKGRDASDGYKTAP